MVNARHAFMETAAVGGIFLVWTNYTIEAFKIAWHIISTSPEEKTCKAVYENCHLIHGTHLCDVCR